MTKSIVDMMRASDGRIHSRFFHTSTLKSTNASLKSKYRKAETARINVIRLFHYYHRMNQSTLVQQFVLSYLYKRFLYALGEK